MPRSKSQAKILTLAFLLSTSCLLLPSEKSWAHEWSSPQADTVQAWFLGSTRHVSWCIAPPAAITYPLPVSGSNFVPSPTFDNTATRNARVKDAVVWAQKNWATYIRTKQLDALTPDSSKLTLRWKYQETCDGHEDLTIYIGEGFEMADNARAKYADPIGFAQRLSYDENKGWGRGFVWISAAIAESKTTEKLQSLLLHELGHVYGCEHVAGTIMDENIRGELNLVGSSGRKKAPPLSIDGATELYTCVDCDFAVADSSYGAQNDLSGLYRKLNDQQLVGPGKIAVYSQQKMISFFLWDKPSADKKLSGPFSRISKRERFFQTWHGMELQLTSTAAIPISDAAIFRRSYRGRMTALQTLGLTQNGFAIAPNGMRYSFILNRNLGSVLHIVLINREGSLTTLFKLESSRRKNISFGTLKPKTQSY